LGIDIRLALKKVGPVALLFLLISSAGAGWWDENWTRRRQIYISSHPENTHLKITLSRDDDMSPDFSDLRFLENENSGILSFWLENYTADSATVWLRRLENSDNSIYVYYGNPAAASSSSWENTVLPYTDSQATGAAAWSPRYGHTSLVFGGKMWVIGGGAENAWNDVWWSTDGSLWIRATENAGWSPRRNHASVVFGNRMWVIGGPDASVFYSENGENWVLATSSPGWSARWGHTSVVFDNKMWVIGGYDGSYKNDVWYSSDGINWTQVTANAAWSGRHGHASVVFDNRMWVIGGYSGGSFKSDVWYSSDGENWFCATNDAGWTPRRSHAAVVFDNRIWIIGGNGYLWEEYLSDLWYSLDGSSWTRVTGTSWSGRYEHSSVVYNDTIWVIGGYDGNYKNDAWRLLRKIATPTPSIQIGEEESKPTWYLEEGLPATTSAAVKWQSVETHNGTNRTGVGWQWVEITSTQIGATPVAAPTPPTRIPTTVILSPSFLTLATKRFQTFTATLKDVYGNPLSGKYLTWSATLGTLSVKATVTDSSGQATVVYAAPDITTAENDTITACFAGDTSYGPSTGKVTVTILPVPPIPTSLELVPASFFVGSGRSQFIKATLRDNSGNLLTGKTLHWEATVGSLSMTSGATDERGELAVTYTAPQVLAETSVVIKVLFEGDGIYSPASATSTGTILTPEMTETLERLRENLDKWRAELGIPQPQTDVLLVLNSLVSGKLGAIATIAVEAGKPEITKEYESQGVRIRLGEVRVSECVGVLVESDTQGGRTVLINLRQHVLRAEKLRILVDHDVAEQADDYADVLDPTNDGDRAEYLILKGDRGMQIAVSIPRFSARLITIAVIPGEGTPLFHLLLLSLVLTTVLLALRHARRHTKHP
jgi:hypothetical protein